MNRRTFLLATTRAAAPLTTLEFSDLPNFCTSARQAEMRGQPAQADFPVLNPPTSGLPKSAHGDLDVRMRIFIPNGPHWRWFACGLVLR